jgi:hypothetical protein
LERADAATGAIRAGIVTERPRVGDDHVAILKEGQTMRTERRCGGFGGLMLAGAIITSIGLALVVGETWHLPRHWQTVAVGLVLLVFGALRWSMRRTEP